MRHAVLLELEAVGDTLRVDAVAVEDVRVGTYRPAEQHGLDQAPHRLGPAARHVIGRASAEVVVERADDDRIQVGEQRRAMPGLPGLPGLRHLSAAAHGKPAHSAAGERIVPCMRWGTKYGPDYVNRPYGMVRRHLRGDFRFVCLTEHSQGIQAAVPCHRIPPLDLPPGIPERGWTKPTTFAADLHGMQGTALFLDLAVVIVMNPPDALAGRSNGNWRFARAAPWIAAHWVE